MNFSERSSAPASDPLADLPPNQYAHQTLQDLQDDSPNTNITDLYRIARLLNHASYALLVDLSAKKRREAANIRQSALDERKETAKAIIKETLLMVDASGPSQGIYDQSRAILHMVNLYNEEQKRIDKEQREVYNILAANSRELFADEDLNYAFHVLADMSGPEGEDESQRRESDWWTVSQINHQTATMMTAMDDECKAFVENLATLLWNSHMKSLAMRGKGKNVPEEVTKAEKELDRVLRSVFRIDFLDCTTKEDYLPQIRRFWRKWAGLVGGLSADFEDLYQFVAGRPLKTE